MRASTDRRRLPEWGDMQGLVLSAYPHLDQAAYLLYKIKSPELTKRWLAQQFEHVTSAFKVSPESRRPLNMNVAFTWSGIKTLCESPQYFADAFIEGIHGGDHRRRMLGDTAESRPEEWKWGGPHCPVDVLVMLFVHKRNSLDDEIREFGPPPEAMTPVAGVPARRLTEAKGREHFGFMDGISQPILEGTTDAERFPESIHLTALGEFVLGYPDATGKALGRPDDAGLVAPLPSVGGCPEFGLNGSYLVMRQLYQDVAGFWRCVADRSLMDGRRDPEAAEQLAAKIVGRWPDGTPLVPYANRDDNEFAFGEDPYGHGCPIGAHVRRANPRDSLENTNLPFTPRNDHRILRRGRSYGAPLKDKFEKDDEDRNRGLVFLGLNADLERQFEFIQENWINNTAFAGLRDERDPLVGSRCGEGDRSGTFTIAGLPAPLRLHDLPRFVTVKGGQYFFMPGLRALGHLAGLNGHA
jgi:Dyp-type peroxidase family